MNPSFDAVLEELKTWNTTFVSLLVLKLFEADKIDYVELSNRYVQDLERRRKELEHRVMPLAMHLSLALDGHPQKESALRLLFECEYFKGSKKHDELETIFNIQNS